MGYLKIANLYKSQDILLFKECYALEKVHGTSAHIKWHEGNVSFFSGGASHELFVSLFDKEFLITKFTELWGDAATVTIFGEAYGGKLQGMSKTYGDKLRFIIFDVLIGERWLVVPEATKVAEMFGLEFVPWKVISTDLDCLTAYRDSYSQVAFLRGMGGDKIGEGLVLRPLIEVNHSGGGRVIVKYKRDNFKETATSRKVDRGDLKVLENTKAIANEWVTMERLRHVLDKLPQGIGVEETRQVIDAMLADILIEGKDEIVDSPCAQREIKSTAAKMFKNYLQTCLEEK